MSRSRVTETSGHETRNPSFTSFDFTPARFMKPINGPAAENSQGKQVGLTIRRHIIFTVTVWPTSEYNSSKSDTLFRSENRIFPSPLNLYCSNEDSDKFEFGEHLNTRRQIPTMFKSGLERFREPYCFFSLEISKSSTRHNDLLTWQYQKRRQGNAQNWQLFSIRTNFCFSFPCTLKGPSPRAFKQFPARTPAGIC